MGSLTFPNGTEVGRGDGAFIVAEAGVNHDGELERAKALVDVADDAGADAVKFQTFRAEKLATSEAAKAEYQKDSTEESSSQFEMLKRLELGRDAHIELEAYCATRSVEFLSTPFGRSSVDFLEELGVSLFKVGSGDLTNLPLLEYISDKGRPMIVSTGMSWLGDVEDAVRVIEDAGNEQLTLLHCLSQYPAPAEHVNLRAMETLEQCFGVPVGFSDHTMGIEVPIAAVARGAEVIEKHFTLDRSLEGPDHEASLEPDELADMIQGIRTVESALGDGVKRPRGEEDEVVEAARKSIVATSALEVGERIDREQLAIRRPGTGLSPKWLQRVVGMRASRDVGAEKPLGWEDLE